MIDLNELKRRLFITTLLLLSGCDYSARVKQPTTFIFKCEVPTIIEAPKQESTIENLIKQSI